MKILFRADDLGYCEAVNYGILKSILEGPIRNVGLMPGMPAAEHGYQLIKDFDIALGQHTNISVGKPLADIKSIPSLVNDAGEFHNSKTINSRMVDTVVIEEAEIEIEAQLMRFQEICGKLPDYIEGHAVRSNNFFIALRNVADRYNLFYCDPFEETWSKETGIYHGKFPKPGQGGVYNPYQHFLEDEAKIIGLDCVLLVFHPGYIDQFLLESSSFTLVRPLEIEFLTSEALKQWMKLHSIQSVNFLNYNT